MDLNDKMKPKEDLPPEIFISYSHDSKEHINWVLQLATRLRSNGVNVILDQWNITLGCDLPAFMERGLSKSNRVICICSDAYVKKANEGKGGSGYEKQIISAEYYNDQNINWVIPLIKNNNGDKKTPTFLGTKFRISFEDPLLYEANYEKLLRDILDEPVLPIPPIGKNPFQTIKDFSKQKFIPSTEKYVSPTTKGMVTFDYSNNDGSYFIGQNELLFEIKFAKAGSQSIYISSYSDSIKSVAVSKTIKNIHDLKDARDYDISSHIRVAAVSQIVILQNRNGFYAALRIIDVKDDTQGAKNDEVTFEYVIQTNGSPDFTV